MIPWTVTITYCYRSAPGRTFTKELTEDEFDQWWAAFAHDPNVHLMAKKGGFAWRHVP